MFENMKFKKKKKMRVRLCIYIYMYNKMREIMMDWDSYPGSLELFSTNWAVWSSGVDSQTSLTMGITLSTHPPSPLKILWVHLGRSCIVGPFFLQELACQIQGLVMVPIFFYKVKLSCLALAFDRPGCRICFNDNPLRLPPTSMTSSH